jgi:hypothetical protein
LTALCGFGSIRDSVLRSTIDGLLTALGLPSAIAQFLDFGAKVFRDSKDIAESGSTVPNTELRGLALDLVQITSSLVTKCKAHHSYQPSREEQDLYDLASQCEKAASQLQHWLDTVITANSDHHFWDSVRVALRTVWHDDHIEKPAQRVGEYRSQLTLRLLLDLNSYHRLQDEKLDFLQNASNEIIEVISLNCRELTSNINRRHAETVAAIFTTRDGSTSSITADNGHQYTGNVRFSLTSTTYKVGPENFTLGRTGIK